MRCCTSALSRLMMYASKERMPEDVFRRLAELKRVLETL